MSATNRGALRHRDDYYATGGGLMQRTRWWKGADRICWPWHVDIDTTRVGLERAMRAMLLTGSTMSEHHRIGDHPLGRGVTALLQVWVPEGEEEAFRELCRPVEMRPPLQGIAGCRPPDDGHPGRRGPDGR